MRLRAKDLKAIAELNEMVGEDIEAEHGRADELLLECVAPEVRDAWKAASNRAGFWYA